MLRLGVLRLADDAHERGLLVVNRKEAMLVAKHITLRGIVLRSLARVYCNSCLNQSKS